MNLETAEQFLSKLYTIDDEPTARCYIFPDGKILHLDSFHSHEEVRQELEDEFGVTSKEADIETQGVIRVNFSSEGFVALSKVPPTQEQYKSLLKVIETSWDDATFRYGDFLIFEPKVDGKFPELGIHKFNTNSEKGYIYSPEEFIKIIRNYYETGRLQEK